MQLAHLATLMHTGLAVTVSRFTCPSVGELAELSQGNFVRGMGANTSRKKFFLSDYSNLGWVSK